MSKDNKLFKALEVNIRAASNSALIKTVVANPEQTIGYILDSLAEQEESAYLLEAFKDIQVGEIVQGAIDFAMTMETAPPEVVQRVTPAPVSAPPQKKNGVSKKAAPPRVAPSNDKPSAIDLSSPDKLKAYESAILKALRDGKHVDEESGISNAHLRKIVGGDTDQCRDVLNALIKSERASFYGKARGTKYYRF